MSKIIPEQKARQGRMGRQMLFVLIAALILLAIGWFAVEMYGQAIDNTPPSTATGQTQ